MSKKILICLSVVILMVLCFYNLLIALEPNPNPSTDPGEPGGGSGELWDRYDWPCPDGVKEKTDCNSGGSSQCTAQYCN